MTKRELIDLCLSFAGSVEDYPFEDEHCIVRHGGNRKWFALILELDGQLCINLKCEPMQADFWRSVYKDCRPGWHMNKQHWNTIYTGGDVPEEALTAMIADSYKLTSGSKREKPQNEQ